MMARSLEGSINRPDTEAQDQPSPNHHFRLATRGRSIQKGQTRTWLLENHYAVAAHGDRLLVCLLASRFLLASIFESLRNLPANGQLDVAVDADVNNSCELRSNEAQGGV